VIRIAQLLCPQRHAVLAIPYDEADMTPESVAELLREATAEGIENRKLKPSCFICGAPAETWHIEDGRTRFVTMSEAMPSLKAAEAANLAAREFLHRSRN
jgi:hypothetical protein